MATIRRGVSVGGPAAPSQPNAAPCAVCGVRSIIGARLIKLRLLSTALKRDSLAASSLRLKKAAH